MYKEAIRLKLRFQTSKGPLSVEQLWQLNLTTLSMIIKGIKKELKSDNDNELAFLDETSAPIDKTLSLMFDIVKDVYLTKKSERDLAANAAEVKATKQRILGRMQELKDGKFNELTKEELQKQLDELN